MKRVLTRSLRQALAAVSYGLLGALIAGLGVFIYMMESRTDLDVWHEARLDEEFRHEDEKRVADLAAYRALEERLFQELRKEVYDRVPSERQGRYLRYSAGSLSDPTSYATNWNRTFELPAELPRGAVLMLHGMSDSPYSLRAVGQALNAVGFRVVGLRLPGHGTAPSGLADATSRDFAAAVRIAARSLTPADGADLPFYIVGYSNGAALAVDYALSVLEGTALPRPEGLILISPAIGVTGAAAFAVWQARIGRWLGLNKLAWNSILPEVDPYKYNSFAVNAGDQVYRITQRIEERLTALAADGPVKGMPPILAFQSIVDATVSTPALVANLFLRLAPEGHELVLFDVNRKAEVQSLYRFDPRAPIVTLLEGVEQPFHLTLLTNDSAENLEVVLVKRDAGSDTLTRSDTDLRWPGDIFSLSHVALPFPPGDRIYGRATGDGRISLGAIEVRGERGLLALPGDYATRLRYNPFFDYLQERILRFVDAR